jgi:hypothetical protein
MDAATQSDLNDLLFHWDQAYDIRYHEAAGTWSARYKTASPNDTLTGSTCGELRQAIRADYQLRRLEEQRLLAMLRERSST